MENDGKIWGNKKSDLGFPYQNSGIHMERYGDLMFEMDPRKSWLVGKKWKKKLVKQQQKRIQQNWAN